MIAARDICVNWKTAKPLGIVEIDVDKLRLKGLTAKEDKARLSV